MSYSYYHSDPRRSEASLKQPSRQHFKRWFSMLIIVALASGLFAYHTSASAPKITLDTASKATLTKPKNPSTTTPPTMKTTPAVAVAAPNPCAGNTLDQLVLVSITQQHLWACQDTTVLYNSPVVTGIAAHVDTVTPTGTYHIYGKVASTVLRGCDSTGCWNDPVHYWMPFLDNQYGAYGLHDATWRTSNEFGNISPSSSDGSQGCVELPLATSTWLYNWVNIGTTVTINA
jgi:lipoprotein-anchoring transpeptidase ErfK/SrfK